MSSAAREFDYQTVSGHTPLHAELAQSSVSVLSRKNHHKRKTAPSRSELAQAARKGRQEVLRVNRAGA